MRKFINICSKCKKEMPFDEEKSNENWRVYKNECTCGSKDHIISFENEDNTNPPVITT